MKASKFTDAQKAFVLKQAEEGLPVGEVCRKAGVTLVDDGKCGVAIAPVNQDGVRVGQSEVGERPAQRHDPVLVDHVRVESQW